MCVDERLFWEVGEGVGFGLGAVDAEVTGGDTEGAEAAAEPFYGDGLASPQNPGPRAVGQCAEGLNELGGGEAVGGQEGEDGAEVGEKKRDHRGMRYWSGGGMGYWSGGVLE